MLKKVAIATGLFHLLATSAFASNNGNVVVDVNNALINIIINTSAALVDGPPEVAREIALTNGAMFDAVNAASGSPYPPIAYGGGTVNGADPNAAALQAALTVMNSLYGPNSVYQQYAGVTGATYYPLIPGYAGALVGPTATQMTEVARQISLINDELTALNPNSTSLSLGTAAGNAMLALAANDGGQAAVLQTLTPFTPPNVGSPGVYAPPSNRPAMTPTWGTVLPMGISSLTLSALEATIPVADAANPESLASQEYALQVLQTECQGSGTGLPSNVASACSAASFAPESAAEAQAALFWNDPGSTLQPPGHWLQIADTIAIQNGLTLLQTAQATAAVGLALHAAGIGAWTIKYQDVAWRPATAIQFSSSWNSYFTTSDSAWKSLIALPPHPDYVAGHPAFSGAAATALAAILGTDSVTFTTTSTAYCNGGTAARNSRGNVMNCVLNGVTHSMPTVCANGATATYDGDPFYPTLIGCTLNGVAQSVTGGGCNNAGSQPVLNPGYMANPLYNGSPLICVIAETFPSLSQASGGFLGAEFSRVVGGIHTPSAVTQALALGNAIGPYIVASACQSDAGGNDTGGASGTNFVLRNNETVTLPVMNGLTIHVCGYGTLLFSQDANGATLIVDSSSISVNIGHDFNGGTFISNYTPPGLNQVSVAHSYNGSAVNGGTFGPGG
jgi:hypothetical protein